jgi:DEAD/DEAH box helicase
MSWFHDVAQLVDILFVGSHVGPGGVARTTEIQTLSMENDCSYPRSVHIMHGYVTTILRYNKSQQNTQMDKLIARFIPPRFGHLFLYYLVIIRSLERVWAADVFGAGQSSAYKNLVFVRYAKPMLGPQFSKVLYQSTLQYLFVGLGISDYRQLIKAILRIVLGIDYDDGDDDDKIEVADEIFGHSNQVGTTMYGLSYTDLPNLTSELIRLHQKYCQHVHRWLGEGEPLPEHVEPLNMTQMTTMFNQMRSAVANALEYNPSEETVVSVINNAARTAIQTTLLNSVIPTIQNTITTELSDTIANMPWQYLIGADTRIPEECHRPIVVQPSTSRMFTRLFGKNAGPKSSQQAQLMQLVVERQRHVMGIIPTGGGKSALYQAPALCEASGITVCIFPFRALTQDQIIQAHELGIAVATWPERHSESPDPDDPLYMQFIPINPNETRLVCVSAHHAGSDEFIPWLRALYNADLLTRVVVDEVHQLLGNIPLLSRGRLIASSVDSRALPADRHYYCFAIKLR